MVTSTPTLEPTAGELTFEELQLAARNRGMPLEALRYDVSPAGLHYLLIHFDIPAVDAATWRLKVGGRVRNPLELSLEQVRSRPSQTITVTLECAGNGRARLSPRPLSQPWLVEAVSTAEWTGTKLGPLLEEAGLGPDAVEVVFTGADRGIQGGVEQDYARSLTIADAMRPEVMLVHAMNGEPLQPQHGFPLRLLVPGWYGMTSVKWLSSIEAIAEPFQGYQQTPAYHYQRDADDPGQPVTRIRVRALMVPPGIPDFFSRRRFLDAGPIQVGGRAWSGAGPVARVEVAVDGHWSDAKLGPPLGDFAWRSWSFDWQATPGEHELACRATDAAGNVQPSEQPWNYQGVGNNLIQQVAVAVR
ncbi:MAG: sulfite oxidase [Chloroflexi bacterium]|nr:MAG: sulfite oxidase [Chloroflexota bacterium]